ncbi:hypothetical protein CFP56_021522 [Quercus suber]|uniref:Uncharacterized protein n=1 Tax=Quercus suber TaxID=58331 RepID=A0AAW0LYS3_QUESU
MAAEDVCEKGMLWLPSHVLDEVCDTKTKVNMSQPQQQHKHYHHHHHKSPKESLPLPQHFKSRSRPHHQRQKNGPNWASGGPGMQAIFLESGRRSGGTGVFLPQRAETNFQPNKKPACSLILLPSRVVQALNLNVHALGLPASPQEGFFSFFFFFFWGCFLVMFDLSLKENYFSDDKTEGRDCNSNINKNDKDLQSQCCASVISQNQSSSPEIFLPKEWTY